MTSISAELRRLVTARANNCCEYCRISQRERFFKFEIDHIIAEKHGGATHLDNLCLCCPQCNGFKGSDIGTIDRQTGILTLLFNPRIQSWDDHFKIEDGQLRPLTPEGRVTVFLLHLNDPENVQERKDLYLEGRYPC